MTKAIVSRNVLYNALNEKLPTKLDYTLTFSPHGCSIDGIDIGGIGSDKHAAIIPYKSINRLWKMLTWLDEQPITIAVDSSNWLYIKDAIL